MRVSFDSKKRKAVWKGQSQEPEEAVSGKSSLREPEPAALPSRSDNSVESLRKALEQVSSSWARERQTRVQLEEKVTKLYKRGIEREGELQRLLQEAIPFCSDQRPTKVSHEVLKQVQQRMVQFFSVTNEMATRKLAQDTSEIAGMMQRKIRSITGYMEQELENSKKLLRLNYESIRKEIARIVALGSAILDENDGLKKELDALRFRHGLLKEEKDMLIVEVLEKKSIITQMHRQLKRSHKKDDLLGCEIGVLKKESLQVEKQYEREIRSKTLNSPPTHANHACLHPRALLATTHDPQTTNAGPNHSLIQRNSIQRQDTYYSTAITKPDLPHHSHSKQQRLFTTIDPQNTQKRTASQISSTANKTQSLCLSKAEGPRQGRTEKLISSLKKELQDERRKSSEQIKKLNRFQIYQREMEGLFAEKLEGGSAARAAKVQELVKELGRRMLSSANPAINSGFHELESLVRQFQPEQAPE